MIMLKAKMSPKIDAKSMTIIPAEIGWGDLHVSLSRRKKGLLARGTLIVMTNSNPVRRKFGFRRCYSVSSAGGGLGGSSIPGCMFASTGIMISGGNMVLVAAIPSGDVTNEPATCWQTKR